MKIQHTFLWLVLIGTFISCNKLLEKPSWKTDIKAPLVKTSLTIANIIRDTTSFQTNTDNSIMMVSRQEVYSLNVDSLVKLEVVPYVKTVKLSTLKLDEQTITRRVSLGELALQMQANGDPIGTLILNSNGSMMPMFAPINNLTAGPMDVDINQFFEEADLLTGTMEIKLENQLPVDITNVQFELRNKNLGTVIANETYPNLIKGTSQTHSIDLAGQMVEGDLEVDVLDMDLAKSPTNFILVDTSDAIIITLTVKDVTVQSATAIFPEQDVINETSETSFSLDNDIKLTHARILDGMVEAEAYSTAEDTVYFTYEIPSATKGGVPFVMETVIPPAPPGGSQYAYFSADFSGYEMDLRGQNSDTVNTFYSQLIGHIEYTGNKINLSLDDSLRVEVRLVNAVPSYVKGYLGDSVISISGSVDIDIFKNIESGTLNFQDVSLSATVENGLGIEGGFQINTLKTVNSKTVAEKTLLAPTSSGTIAPALDNPLRPVSTPLSIGGSNTVELLNILPDKIIYDVDVQLNPSGVETFDNFVYTGSSLRPYIDIELPLSIIASDLVLSDTADFLSDNFQTSVNSGTFSINVENGFPLNGDLKVYFLDHGGSLVDSVVSSGTILAAPVDATNKVTSKKPSKISFHVDENRMQNILRARQVVFKIKFSTEPFTPGDFVKIYSDYSIDFKLIGDFNYTINQ